MAEVTWRRIDGDRHVALRFRAVADTLKDIEAHLSGGDIGRAGAAAGRGQLLLNLALNDLERITEIPWTALEMDAEFGR